MLFAEHRPIRFYVIVVLHILRVLGRLTINIYLVIADAERVARHTDAPLHVIFPFIHRTIHDFAKSRFIELDSFPSVHGDQRIIVRILLEQGNRIACREIKDHNIIALHFAQAGNPFIAPFRPIEVRFAVQARKCVLHQRKCYWRIRNARPVAQFTHKQIIAHQQRLLQGRTGNLIVLKQEHIDKIDGDQGENNIIHPTQRRLYRRIL